MNKSVIIFLFSALIGLGLGYLVFDVIAVDNSNQEQASVNEGQLLQSTEVGQEQQSNEGATTDIADGNILQAQGCLSCHAVSRLGLQGGATGPDLSEAFNNIEDKHGKALDEFLKEPTSAVMSTVMGGNPLTDDEIAQIVDVLKEAAEK